MMKRIVSQLVVLAALGTPIATHAAQPQEQAVIISLKLSDDAFGAEGESFALYPIEDALENATKGVGELDGHEIGKGYFTIYFYGADAKAIERALYPTLLASAPRAGSFLIERFGPPGTRQTRIELAPPTAP